MIQAWLEFCLIDERSVGRSRGAGLTHGGFKSGSPDGVGEDPLLVLAARRTYKSKRRQEGELRPPHGFFVRVKFA